VIKYSKRIGEFGTFLVLGFWMFFREIVWSGHWKIWFSPYHFVQKVRRKNFILIIYTNVVYEKSKTGLKSIATDKSE